MQVVKPWTPWLVMNGPAMTTSSLMIILCLACSWTVSAGEAVAGPPTAGTPPVTVVAPPSEQAPAADPGGAYAPHTPTIIFYLAGMTPGGQDETLKAAMRAVKSASIVTVNSERGYVRVRFDSHIISYHQIAQAISDAGLAQGVHFEPRIVIGIPDYAKDGHAAQVDAIFSGKRLNERVVITAIDKAKGLFAVSFRPLQVDPTITQPQGFNGGHLHHPIHDPPPRGLGLACDYLTADDPTISLPDLPPKSGAPGLSP